jgi:hypothetical protein
MKAIMKEKTRMHDLWYFKRHLNFFTSLASKTLSQWDHDDKNSGACSVDLKDQKKLSSLATELLRTMHHSRVIVSVILNNFVDLQNEHVHILEMFLPIIILKSHIKTRGIVDASKTLTADADVIISYNWRHLKKRITQSLLCRFVSGGPF